MTIGTQSGVTQSESIINPLKIHYDVSVDTSLYSNVEKTTNSVLDGGIPTGEIKSFKNLASSRSRDSVQTGTVDVLYQSDGVDSTPGAKFNINSYHIVPNISTLNDFINMTFIFVIQTSDNINRIMLSNLDTGTTNSLGSVTIETGINRFSMKLRTDTSNNNLTSATTFSNTSRVIGVFQINETSGSCDMWTNFDKTTLSINGTVTSGNGQNFVFGGFKPTNDMGFNGHIYEFKCYNTILSELEVNTEIGNLSNKWDLALQRYTSNVNGSAYLDPNFTKLTNGIIGSLNFGDGNYCGWYLLATTNITIYLTNTYSSITFYFLENHGASMYLPNALTINGIDTSWVDTVYTSDATKTVYKRKITTTLNMGKHEFVFTRDTAGEWVFISEYELE